MEQESVTTSQFTELQKRTRNTRFSSARQPKGKMGRPRTKFISEALRQMCETGKSGEYAKELDKLALKAKHPSVRLAAINTIADRTEGKPVQAHLVAATIDDNTARRLTELADLLRS